MTKYFLTLAAVLAGALPFAITPARADGITIPKTDIKTTEETVVKKSTEVTETTETTENSDENANATETEAGAETTDSEAAEEGEATAAEAAH